VCHGETVQQKNVDLRDAAGLKRHAQNVYQQVAVSKLMPLGNATGMTEAERALVRRWYEVGAPVQ
jgi:uncharacterized membrane protein